MDVEKYEKYSDSQKCFYALIFCLIRTSFGMANSCFGPSFVDLKVILDTGMDKISLMNTFLHLAFMMGSLFGFLYEYIDRQIILITLLIIKAFATMLIPYSEELWHLYFFISLYGLGSGAWNSSNRIWVLEMWPKPSQSAAILHLSGFMYGLGTILGPIIERPYLTGVQEFEHNFNYREILKTEVNQTNDISLLSSNNIISMRRYKLQKPFFIFGIIHLIGPVLMIFIFVIRQFDERVTNKKKYMRRTSREKQCQEVLLIILGCIFLAFFTVSETIYLRFGATYYQYIPLELTANQSAGMVSVMAMIYTIGRGISFFLSIELRPQLVIGYHTLVLIVSFIVLLLGQNTLTLLLIGSMTMSFGYSCITASTFAYIGQYVEMTDRIGTILTCSSRLLTLFIPYVMGKYIETHPKVFIITMFTNIVICVFVFIVILTLVMKDSFKKQFELKTSDKYEEL